MDSGCTVVARAGRVHPDFEGLGLVKDLSNFMIQRAAAEGAKSLVLLFIILLVKSVK